MIELSHGGAIATLRMNRPEQRNALSLDHMADFSKSLRTIAADANARVIIITGTGSTFCAGADFSDLAAGKRPDIPLSALSDQLASLRIPTIAALNGSVFGAGVDLALACDFRLGVKGMAIAIPAGALGVHYPGAAIARVQNVLGPSVARRMLLAAERFTGDDLLHLGIVDQLVDTDALWDTAVAQAHAIAKLAPLAVEGMKRSLLNADDATSRVSACFASIDHREALLALSQKRPAQFTGR